ncbi:MAG: PaRep2b protein, partial [Pyrobaculum sp.]|nr:PaRep2b protein [Pyrobaculum sp.]
MELGAGGVLSVSWEGLRKTEGGLVAADLIISVGGAAVKYNVYLLKDAIVLQFVSTDRGRVELAERLLKLAGVSAKMKKVGEGGEWHVWATTNKLAAGRKELRDALAEIVRAAVENGWVDADKAERWLEKLERGRVLREGWPKYLVRLKEGALMVRFGSTNLNSVEEEARRFREMGLVEGVHFSVKMPEGGRDGYVSILK